MNYSRMLGFGLSLVLMSTIILGALGPAVSAQVGDTGTEPGVDLPEESEILSAWLSAPGSYDRVWDALNGSTYQVTGYIDGSKSNFDYIGDLEDNILEKVEEAAKGDQPFSDDCCMNISEIHSSGGDGSGRLDLTGDRFFADTNPSNDHSSSIEDKHNWNLKLHYAEVDSTNVDAAGFVVDVRNNNKKCEDAAFEWDISNKKQYEGHVFSEELTVGEKNSEADKAIVCVNAIETGIYDPSRDWTNTGSGDGGISPDNIPDYALQYDIVLPAHLNETNDYPVCDTEESGESFMFKVDKTAENFKPGTNVVAKGCWASDDPDNQLSSIGIVRNEHGSLDKTAGFGYNGLEVPTAPEVNDAWGVVAIDTNSYGDRGGTFNIIYTNGKPAPLDAQIRIAASTGSGASAPPAGGWNPSSGNNCISGCWYESRDHTAELTFGVNDGGESISAEGLELTSDGSLGVRKESSDYRCNQVGCQLDILSNQIEAATGEELPDVGIADYEDDNDIPSEKVDAALEALEDE
jgi:hypothetical protein